MCATILFIGDWIVSFLWIPTSPGTWLSPIAAFFVASATYAAATDMDWSVYYSLGRFQRSRHLRESSAAQIAALIAVGIIAMEIVIWLIVMSEAILSANEGLSLLLSSCGAITAAIGGFAAWRKSE